MHVQKVQECHVIINKRNCGTPMSRKGLAKLKFVNLWRTHGDLRSIHGEIRQLTSGEPMVTLFE
jgi:hypothetical protein